MSAFLCTFAGAKNKITRMNSMKKWFLMAAAAMIAGMSAQGQTTDEPKNEIGVSYGLGFSLIGDGIASAIGNGLFESLAGRDWENRKEIGTFALEYYRHMNDNDRLALGGIVTYAQMGEDVAYKGTKEGERTRHYVSVMPSVKYYWVSNKAIGLYSKAAVGAMFVFSNSKDLVKDKTDNDSKVAFMFQASLLGFEAGSRNARAFVELGAGEQGIIMGGLRCKF